MMQGQAGLGPLIAIVGTDGSGKSTVGDALVAWLAERRPAALCHLGKQSGNLGRAVGRLPLVGRGATRSIDRKVRASTSDRGPPLAATVAIFLFALRRVRRFRRMQRLRARGVAIVADRFPQLGTPAAVDGLGFARVAATHGLARRLAGWERRRFQAMVENRPDVVIRLHVDLATALARKPDHRPDLLATKIAEVPTLSFGGAPIVDIDATRPLAEVVAAAKAAVAAVLGEAAPA